MMAIESLVKDYVNVAKLSKVEGAPELVLDAILSHFGYDDCDLKEGVERLYTMGKIKHGFRSVLNKGEDMPAILDWFKGCLGIPEEALADINYAISMADLAKEFLAKGHDVCGQKYLELAAAKGCPDSAAALKDLVYAKTMFAQALESFAKGHCVSGAKYLELAADKGLVKAQNKQADISYAKCMMTLAKESLAKGHKVSGKKYVELAAAKGCPCAQELLATL